MGRMPEIVFHKHRKCVDCLYGLDYRTFTNTRHPCTVKCLKHNCRVYAFDGVCRDFRLDKDLSRLSRKG